MKEVLNIDPQVALQLAAGAMLETEDELRRCYAELVARAADPTEQGSLKRRFVEILRSMDVEDLRVLQALYFHCCMDQVGIVRWDRRDRPAVIENLRALGLVETEEHIEGPLFHLFAFWKINLTNLGVRFFEACVGDVEAFMRAYCDFVSSELPEERERWTAYLNGWLAEHHEHLEDPDNEPGE